MAGKERRAFLAWRREHYPGLKTNDAESDWLWQGWQARALQDSNKLSRILSCYIGKTISLRLRNEIVDRLDNTTGRKTG